MIRPVRVRFRLPIVLASFLAAGCSPDVTSPVALRTDVAMASLAPSSTCQTCVFGPRVFVRAAGEPITESVSFTLASAGSFIIDIDDGGSAGADGSVILNGEVLLAPRLATELGPRHVRKVISLTTMNELQVRLMGKPQTRLTISVLLRPGVGPLVVWGTDDFALEGAPSGYFESIAAGGNDLPRIGRTLAIRADGTLYLSAPPDPLLSIPPIPSALLGRQFVAVGMGRYHALAIGPDGAIETWGRVLPGIDHRMFTDWVPTAGNFIAVAGGRHHSVGLDADGNVVNWGGGEADGAPAGIEFTAVAARALHTLALAANGDIYGWGLNSAFGLGGWEPLITSPGHFVARGEAGNPYVAVAAGATGRGEGGLIVALRADGSVVMWDRSGAISPPPAGVAFTQIAAGLGYVVGIDREGRLHAWSDLAHTAFTAVPPGFYSAISAGPGHATAIAIGPTAGL